MRWLRRIRGAIGMGIAWALGWAVAGILIGVASTLLPWLPWHYFFDVFDAPLPAMAVPGFFAGAAFSIVLGIAARRRRFHELSRGVFTAWGAAAGLLLVLPIAVIGAMNVAAQHRTDLDPMQLLVVGCGSIALLSAASAWTTLTIARRGERPAVSADARRPELERDQSRPWR